MAPRSRARRPRRREHGATITYTVDADGLDGTERQRPVCFRGRWVELRQVDQITNASTHDTGNDQPSARQRAVLRDAAHPLRSHGHQRDQRDCRIDNLVITSHDRTTPPPRHAERRPRQRHLLVQPRRRQRRHQRRRLRHQRRRGGPDLDPGSERVDATGQPIIDPVTLLPVPTITALNAFDNNTATQTGDLVINYSLPTGPTTSVAQTITVAGHFTGTNAADRRRTHQLQRRHLCRLCCSAPRTTSSAAPIRTTAIPAASTSSTLANAQANFVVGEQGVDDVITGGGLNDLIFGGTGNNDLVGGLGDDLLVGGSATTSSTPGINVDRRRLRRRHRRRHDGRRRGQRHLRR